MTAQRFQVSEPSRLNRFLKDRLNRSQKEIKEWLHRGLAKVNGRTERFSSYQLKKGDLVELLVVPKAAKLKPVIIFEDEALIVYDKPAFISSEELVVPGLIPLHRLDKETSGLILLAKNEEAAKPLLKAFRERMIEKEYTALVEGSVVLDRGILKSRLAPSSRFEGQVRMGGTKIGSYAETHYVVQKRLANSTLVLCYPKTGRTHQIRVQMKELGHPLVGDYSYGAKTIKSPRLLLHASSLKFMHPLDKAEKILHSPLPVDFKQVIKNEDRNC